MNIGIGKAIQFYRERAGMSQREFAKALGYKNHSSIARIENGTQDVLVSTVELMAKTLNVSPAAFFFYDSEDVTEYLPAIREATDETLRTIRYMLHMPEQKKRDSSSTTARA